MGAFISACGCGQSVNVANAGKFQNCQCKRRPRRYLCSIRAQHRSRAIYMQQQQWNNVLNFCTIRNKLFTFVLVDERVWNLEYISHRIYSSSSSSSTTPLKAIEIFLQPFTNYFLNSLSSILASLNLCNIEFSLLIR